MVIEFFLLVAFYIVTQDISVGSTSEVWEDYFLCVLLGNTCKVCYRNAFSQKYQVGNQKRCCAEKQGHDQWLYIEHPLLSLLPLRAISKDSGAMASSSFACDPMFLWRGGVLGKAKLPVNPLGADSRLWAVQMESASQEARMLQSAEIPQWTTQF